MKYLLQTSVGDFGPFTSIIEDSTWYDCDGGLYPKTVVGENSTILEVPNDWMDPTQLAAALVSAKRNAIALVNRRAGETRQKFITDIPGQESTYLIKEAEARAWLTAVDPVSTDYPLINAEANACGWTMEYTVNYIMTTANMFRQIAALVEGLRRGAIVTIEAATTIAAVEAATVIAWP